MITIEGRGNIKATIIQDSMNGKGDRVTTFELEYPRFIHSELMTHRQFSRNAASSRAIPVDKMLDHIKNNPASPVHWGKNQPGMSAREELDIEAKSEAKHIWNHAARSAATYSKMLIDRGCHKQISNRVTEPFQIMKTIVTATNYTNWFWLRHHADAQPEIHELAKVMMDAIIRNVPMLIHPGEWHVPYVQRFRDGLNDNVLKYVDNTGYTLTTQEALEVSASCCAQVSYRKLDDTLEKARDIFQRLIHSEPKHASPVEHQATPMTQHEALYTVSRPPEWEPGITHVDRDGKYWSANFKGFIQHRQLIPGQSR